jgi:hypothetical protein
MPRLGLARHAVAYVLSTYVVGVISAVPLRRLLKTGGGEYCDASGSANTAPLRLQTQPLPTRLIHKLSQDRRHLRLIDLYLPDLIERFALLLGSHLLV